MEMNYMITRRTNIINLGLLLISIITPALIGKDFAFAALQAPLAKGQRILGIQVNEAKDGDFGKAFAAAKNLGAQSVSLAMNWDAIEIAPLTYAPDRNFLADANAFYPPQNVKLDLFIRAMDTNGAHLPSDLKNRAFDDPVVADRFVKMMDYVWGQMPAVKLDFLGVGNEIDLGLSGNRTLYTQYAVFLKNVRQRLHAQKPDLKIGVSATLYGLAYNQVKQMAYINQFTDIVLVTYYPILGDFTVRDPAVVQTDINALVGLYPGRPIGFSEAGCPSSSEINSSEAKQAQFVREMFRAWDAHASQIRLVAFFSLTDFSPAAADDFSRYYFTSSPQFKAYIGSLGLRTWEGTDKQSYSALQQEAKARGW